MKYADDAPYGYPNLHETAQDCLRNHLDEQGEQSAHKTLATVATMEAQGQITDLATGEAFTQTTRWEPFVNFWMDWKWREKKQRNYVQLAITMQAIAQRDGAAVSQADDFDTWCELAKYYRSRYFQRIAPMIVMLCLLCGIPTHTANAATQDITISYLGTEIIEENGTPNAINTYYIDCAGEDYTITLAVHFVSGDLSIIQGDNYCQAKIYLHGYISLVEVIAATSAPQPVNLIYFPMVAR